MMGAGRDDPPDSNGRELYAVIGNAPRGLDRNAALIGRVLQGMEPLSTVPRGSGGMGFHTPAGPPAALTAPRVAADVPAAERSSLDGTFHTLLAQRRERHDPGSNSTPSVVVFACPGGLAQHTDALADYLPKR